MSSKAATNKKWTSSDKYRKNWRRIFESGAKEWRTPVAMDVVVRITAVIRNCCEPSDLAAMKMDLAEYLDWLVKQEGLIGVLDFDTAEIIQARFRKSNDPEFPDS